MKQLDLFNTKVEKPSEEKNTSALESSIVPIAPEVTEEPGQGELAIIPVNFTKRTKKQKNKTDFENEETASIVTNTATGRRGRKSYKETDIEIALVEVPDDEILFKKQYYSMGEVAGWFNVNHSLIRYWENEFDILKPRKNAKGDRLFRPEDIKNLQLIYYLLRNCKYSVEGAKQYLKDNKKKADLDMKLIASLTKFRFFLLELQANLQP